MSNISYTISKTCLLVSETCTKHHMVFLGANRCEFAVWRSWFHFRQIVCVLLLLFPRTSRRTFELSGRLPPAAVAQSKRLMEVVRRKDRRARERQRNASMTAHTESAVPVSLPAHYPLSLCRCQFRKVLSPHWPRREHLTGSHCTPVLLTDLPQRVYVHTPYIYIFLYRVSSVWMLLNILVHDWMNHWLI